MGDSLPVTEKEVIEQTIISQTEELKAWIGNQTLVPELPDKSLALFLHSCFYDIGATKQTLLAYFKLRIESPFYFSDRNPFSENIKEVTTYAYCFLLPGTTEEGYKVIMCGYLPWNDKYQYKNNIKRFMMQIDMWISKLEIYSGFIIVIDSQNSCLSHYTSAPFDGLRKLIVYFQEALPVRLKSIFFINISAATNLLLAMAQPILSKKISNMIHRYTTGDEGYLEYLPKRMLPKEFDGELETINELNDVGQKELEDYSEWFEEQDKIIASLAQKHALSSKKK